MSNTSWFKVSNKLNIDQLAEMFGLPKWEDLDDNCMEYCADVATYTVKDHEGTEEEREVAYQAAELEARDEIFGQWYDSVMAGVERMFELHGLTLTPVTKDRRPYEYRVTAEKSWNEAAKAILETVNGVGMFHFNGLNDFLSSGPYTARKATLGHLGYISRYGDVFGCDSAKSLYERNLRSYR